MMFRCTKCGRTYKVPLPACERCGNVLLFYGESLRWQPQGSGVWRYQSMLPVKRSISLSEGGTPLIRRRDVKEEVYLKVEGDNPTGSFKDRGSTVVLSDAYNQGRTAVTVASTGNMGASVAAYAAYANLRARVFIPTGIPQEKIAQLRAYGAEVLPVEGGFQGAVERSKEEAIRGAYLASSGLNPYFIEGLKTLGLELEEQMGVPDVIIVPTGTGGLLTSIFKAFEELRSLGVIRFLPRMVAVQSAVVAPIVEAWRTGDEIKVPPAEADTIASAILVKSPFNGYSAIDAMRRSGGCGVTVTDDELIAAIKALGHEGIFAEPAAAASLAALDKVDRRKDDRVAVIVTGSGLKDPSVLLRTR